MSKILSFGAFQLDTQAHQLSRHGKALSLPPKAVDALEYLVVREGQLTTRQQLNDALWQDRVVEDQGLNQLIHLLRKALGPRDDGEPWIETVRKRGYRFNGQVVRSRSGQVIPPDFDHPGAPTASSDPTVRAGGPEDGAASRGSSRPANSRWHRSSAAGCDETTTAIAVLPFSFAGPDPTQAWVADGLTEEMIAGFSRLAKLRVTSRTSSATLKGSERHSRDIAELLGVSYLLEGGVVGDGTRLRINVRLIDAQRDDHLWSRHFVGDVQQIFDIQERIARAVLAALRLRLAPAEEKAFAQPAVNDIAAWHRVVLARQAALRWRPDTLEEARTLLGEALELTGDNAMICATMGRVLLNYREAGIPSDEDLLSEASAWSERARAADAHHPETRILSGWLAHVKGDLGQAIQELEAALETDRDHTDALLLLAFCLLRTGQPQRARPIIDHTLAVDPLTPLTRCMPGFLYALEGRFEQATGPYRDMLDRDPGNPVARLFNVWVLFGAGRDDEAIAIANGFEGPGAQSLPALLARAMEAAHFGKLENLALPVPIERAAQQSEMFARHAAEAWAFAGVPEQAALWLDRAVDLGFSNWPYLAQHSPFLSPLVDDKAMQPVLARARRRYRELNSAATPRT